MNKPAKEYQAEAVELGWKSLKENGFYALYFEPQMGKTFTVISLMEKAHMDGIRKFMFLTSATLMDNTKIQMLSHSDLFTEEDIYIYRSIKMKAKKNREIFIRKEWQVAIVNYEAFASPTQELTATIKSMGSEWMLICDEETKIKNHAAKRTKMMAKLVPPAKYKVGLTGTPLAESNIDLYSPWEIRKKSFWRMTYNTFKLNFCKMGIVYLPGGVAQEVIKGNKNTEELKQIIAPYCYVARRQDWLHVPIESHDKIMFALSPPERKAYDEMKAQLFTILDSGDISKVKQELGLYNKFRRICGGWIDEDTPVKDGVHTKLSTMLEMLEDETSQVIIWSPFRDEIKQLKRELSKIAPTRTYFGDDSMDDRAQTMADFKAGKVRFLVANPEAGAYGHSLQMCSNQIWYSLHPSYEKFSQGKDRIQGIGAGDQVYYRYMIAKDSIEERLFSALERKEDAADSFMRMSKSEIMQFV